jgi:hypothetical protein
MLYSVSYLYVLSFIYLFVCMHVLIDFAGGGGGGAGMSDIQRAIAASLEENGGKGRGGPEVGIQIEVDI